MYFLMFTTWVCENTLKYRIIIRGSRPEVFYETDVQRNFEKPTEKNLRQSLFFKLFAGVNLKFIKKETLEQFFCCEFC